MNKIEIPEGVVNVKEYLKYVALEKNPILHNTMYISSEGDEINIGMLPHMLRRRITHLSNKEQEDIMEMKRRYNQLRAKVAMAKSLAYGRTGRYGGLKKEEYSSSTISPFVQDAVELLGRMFTTQEVTEIIAKENNIEVDEQEIKDIFRKNITLIEKKREEFRNKVTDVRLYSKRPRLEELAWMYSRMKQKFILVNSGEAYNAMLRTLEQIRKESEGDILTVNGALDINIEATIQNHIQAEILKTVNLKEIILSRVAARMNYDPVKLIAGLHNSYYAKFVEISGDYDADADMHYPSQSAYDFARIERESGKEVVDVTPVRITEEETKTAKSIRELFMEKLKNQKEKMNNKTATMDDEGSRKRDKVTEDETPMKRGKGSGKDKLLPSKSASALRRKIKKGYK